MIYPELKDLETSDYDLDNFVPEDPTCFGIAVTAHIGPRGEEGVELFQFTVCTPTWLVAREFQKGFSWGFGHLFVSRWDLDVVRRAIRNACIRAARPDWQSSATYLSKYAHWEFEGYREPDDA